MLGFFGTFSQSFMFAIMLWPFAAAVLTLPLLLAHYIRYRRIARGRAGMVYAMALYLLALGLFTLYPAPDDAVRFCAGHQLQAQLMPLGSIMDIPTEGLRAVLQVVMNIIFFVPLGVFLRAMYGWRWYWVAAIGLGASLAIETSQLTGIFGLYPCSYRLFDVDDLLLNTTGALLGFGLGVFFPNIRAVDRGQAIITNPGLVRRLVAYTVDGMAITAMSTVIGVVLQLACRPSPGEAVLLRWGVVAGVTVIVQLIMPLVARGMTIGGRVTGACLDDQERGWLHRLVFYLARLDCLLLMGTAVGALLLFMLGAITWHRHRQLPYHLVDRWWHTDPPQSTTASAHSTRQLDSSAV